jgi:SNARE protein
MPRLNTNDDHLDRAQAINAETTAKLRASLVELQAVRSTAVTVAATLEQDRDKVERVSAGLDTVDSELAIGQRQLTTVIKRIATNRIVIAFVFLIVIGVAGIIVYAALNPTQKIFAVPDAIKPPIPGNSTGAG